MKILVADDEQAVRESLRRSLRFNGYDVVLAVDGEDALDQIRIEQPDLTILDLMMPKLDGLGVCRTLRSSGYDGPILMLTARDGVSDRVAGLDAGADDYLPKPFALEELLARVGSLLRRTRSEARKAASKDQTRLQFEDLVMDTSTRDVTRGGRAISLTRTEFALLHLLLRSPGRAFSRAYLLDTVWGQSYVGGDRSVDNAVLRLRKKLGPLGDEIETVWGVGYRLRPER